METLMIIMIVVFAVIGVFASAKTIDKTIKKPISRFISLEKRLEFHDTTITSHSSKLHNDGIDIKDNGKLINDNFTRLLKVEKLAENFDRDMNKFNSDIMKDVNLRFKGFEDKLAKLEQSDSNHYKIQLTHAKMLSAVEKRLDILDLVVKSDD